MKKVIILLLATALVLTGCGNNKYKEGFTDGYAAGYGAGYNEGLSKSGHVDEEEQTYILNKNSKKFHKPTCSSVSKMKESNKVERIATRTELIEEGYSPCQSCKP